jgi:hypothetical protein
MKELSTYVTQSKFFTPEFNAAIFDGPIRIYFAQYQEAQALKVYFNLQERFGEIRRAARGPFRDLGRSIFVMLYPTEKTFDVSFIEDSGAPSAMGTSEGAEAGSEVAQGRLGEDYVVGVRGPLDDDRIERLYAEMDAIVRAAEA